jgi:hypothetical protein
LPTFETELLAEEENFAGLEQLNRELIGRAETLGSPYRTVLDMDSTEIPVYGEQEQSACNGHFESTGYHPLLLFNREAGKTCPLLLALLGGEPSDPTAVRNDVGRIEALTLPAG